VAVLNPADERVPLRTLVPLAAQHLMVMITAPISSVFLVAHALRLDTITASRLLSAYLLMCAVGTALQSTGPLKIGARMPFVMLPGGAATIIFILVAQQTGLRTATGAVLLTAACCLLLVPVFIRILRFFPPLVLGVVVIVVGLNLLRISAQLILGPDGSATTASIGLMAATIAITVLLFRFLPGGWRRFAVLLGMVAGATLASATGQMGAVVGGPTVSWPQPLPFGPPDFDVIATIPMVLFAIGAMADATGQTVVNAEAIGKRIDYRRDVGGTIRGDLVTTAISGFFGGPIMVTSGENVGIVRVTGVRSRFVTLGTAVLLALLALFAPITRLISALPSAVVGGTAMIVFTIIAALGVKMIQQVDLANDGNLMVATFALVAGLIPVVAPSIYQHLPTMLRLVLANGVTMAALVGVLGNLLFNWHSIRNSEARSGDLSGNK
jgi:xanthine/uracil permease